VTIIDLVENTKIKKSVDKNNKKKITLTNLLETIIKGFIIRIKA
jgi:hypothetical protein